jgi:hypothetical protein
MQGITARELSIEELLLEFESHSQPWVKTPTALVSATTNLLRVIHLAFQKVWAGEDVDQIEMLFIVPDPMASGLLHCAKDLALQLGKAIENPQAFQYEYVFEWQIPESAVIHRIAMSTLARRGFDLHQLCGKTGFYQFPTMIEFQKLIRSHWKGMPRFDRGHASGAAACLFGLHSLTYRMAEEFLALACPGYDCGSVRDGIEDAVESFVSSIGDGLMAFEAELSDLSEAASMLDDIHIADIGEVVCDFSGQPDEMDRALTVVRERYQVRRDVLESDLAKIYLEIGY